MRNGNGKNSLSFRKAIGELSKVNGRRSAMESVLLALLIKESKEIKEDNGRDVPWRRNDGTPTEKTKHI